MARETGKDGRPIHAFASAEAFEDWLEREHATSDGIWLKFAKKGSGVASVSYAEAVEAGLCYGWIDSHTLSLDERFYLQKFTPRRTRSKWSRLNRDKVEELARRGRMKPAGLAEVERAKQDGRWEAAYEGQRNSTVPADLQRELDARPRARAAFSELNGQNRFAILYRLQDAKRPETRARRLAKFVAMLEKGEKIHP